MLPQSGRLSALGIVTLIPFVAASVVDPNRLGLGLLAVSYFLLMTCLSGPFFLALEQITGATWSSSIRAVPLGLTRLLPIPALWLFAVILLFPDLHYATDPESLSSTFKEFWQGRLFLIVRSILYLSVWVGFSRLLVNNSLRHDGGGPHPGSKRLSRISVLFLVLFSLTFWLSTQDWILSLTPDWHSTVFAVYNFAGFFLGGIAAIILLSLGLSAKPDSAIKLEERTLLQFGRLLFAISCIWAYLWFSQYMLIWYAHIPWEAGYFVNRLRTDWASLFYLCLTLNWLIPFLALMPHRSKTSPSTLGKIAAVVLIGHWVEIYLMIFPNSTSFAPWFGLPESLIVVTASGALLWTWRRTAG
jgi:hypothetical protein